MTWLRCDKDAKGTHVLSLYCGVYRKYQTQLHSCKNFWHDWIDGCMNHHKSSLHDHAKSDVRFIYAIFQKFQLN